MMKKKALRSISYLWLGSMFSAGISFLTQLIIARNFATEQYGIYSTTLSIINLIIPLAGFGIAPFWLKIFGEEGWKALRWVPPSLKFLIFSSLILVILINFWSFFGPNDQATRNTMVIMSFMIVGLAFQELLFSILQLQSAYIHYALWQLAVPLLRFIFTIMILSFSIFTLENIAISYTLISIIMLASSIFYLRKLSTGQIQLDGHEHHNEDKEPTFQSPSYKELLYQCWFFGFAGLFYIIWSQSSIIIVKYLLGDSPAGIYSVAILVINAICLLPTVIYTKYFLPKIHRWANSDPHKLKEIYVKGNRAIFTVGLIAMLLLIFFSEKFILITFGEKYMQTANILILSSVILPIRFLSHNMGSLLVVKNIMKTKVRIMAVVAVTSIILSIILIKYLGLYGIIISSIVCETLLLVLYYLLVRKVYVSKMWK